MKSDRQLQHDIIAELEWDPSVDATRLGVEVSEGVVSLSGEVASYLDKWQAERAAQRVSGVRALAIQITVKLAGSAVRTDEDIARTAANVLSWTAAIPPDQVKVVVENGWITLTGEVAWDYQREAASEVVRGLLGTAGISNQLIIRFHASNNGIKADIEAALKRRRSATDEHIEVSVNEADVTLTGTVRGWMEREAVVHSAWGTAGVRSVIDKITVA